MSMFNKVSRRRDICNISMSDELLLWIEAACDFKPLHISSGYILEPQILSYVIQGIVITFMTVDEKEMSKTVRYELLADFFYISGERCLGHGHRPCKVRMIECEPIWDYGGYQTFVRCFSNPLGQISGDNPVCADGKGRTMLLRAPDRYQLIGLLRCDEV